MNKLVSYQTILAAQNGDSKAMESIIARYDPLISKCSTRLTYDEYGNAYKMVDEEMKSRIVAEVIYQTICNFDLMKLQPNEELED